MARIYDEVRPGDIWTTYGPDLDAKLVCEAPRHEGMGIPGYTIQLFTRDEELVGFWATCKACHDLMYAALESSPEIGGYNATPEAR